MLQGGSSGGSSNIIDISNYYSYISDTGKETKTYTVERTGVYFVSACGFNTERTVSSTGQELMKENSFSNYLNYAFYRCNVGDTITVSITNPNGTSSITILELGNLTPNVVLFSKYNADTLVTYTNNQSKGNKYLVLLAPSGRDSNRKTSRSYGVGSLATERKGTYTILSVVQDLLDATGASVFTCNGYGYGGGCIVAVSLI